MHDLKRNLYKSVHSLLELFPAVILLGARQVGKSTQVKHILPDANYFDLEKDSDFTRINNDPELLFKEETGSFIFDEAQKSPALFMAIRVEIDQKRSTNGRFIITGSSSPELLKNITETLAGRCVIVEVNGFSWNEALEQSASNFIQCLQTRDIDSFKELKASFNYPQLLELCLFGSYPELFLRKENNLFVEQWRESYVKTYIERDIRDLFPSLNFNNFKRFVKMSCFSSGEIINYSNFSRSLDVSQPTIKNYFDILEGTFIWRNLPSYNKNPKKRVIKMPKGYLKDTGLINYFLKINSIDDLKSHPQYGHIWESFISEQIIRRMKESLIQCDFFHYRTSNHAEIDLILEGNFGVTPIEIKSGSSTPKKQLRAIELFIKENNCDYGIVINSGDSIFKLTEKIIQIPAIYL